MNVSTLFRDVWPESGPTPSPSHKPSSDRIFVAPPDLFAQPCTPQLVVDAGALREPLERLLATAIPATASVAPRR